MNKNLLCTIGLLSYCSLNAVFYKAVIYYDPKSDHTAILLGDVHLPDKFAASQRYQLMQEIAQIPNAHIITEDKASKHPLSFALGVIRSIELPLCHSYFWSKAFIPNAANVEFRPPTISGFAPLYATRVLGRYNQIQQLNTDFKEHKSEIIGSFAQTEQPILYKMLLHPGTIKTFNLLQRLKQAAGRPHVTEYPNSPIIGEAALVDIAILSEITKDRKADLLSVVLAGGWHTSNVANQLEKKGYQKIYDEGQEIENSTKHSSAIWNYSANVTPINVKELFSAAYDDKRLAIERVPISRTKHLVLDIMRHRAALELGHHIDTGEKLKLGAWVAHKYMRAHRHGSYLAIPIFGSVAFGMGIGFGALYSCYKVMKKFELGCFKDPAN